MYHKTVVTFVDTAPNQTHNFSIGDELLILETTARQCRCVTPQNIHDSYWIYKNQVDIRLEVVLAQASEYKPAGFSNQQKPALDHSTYWFTMFWLQHLEITGRIKSVSDSNEELDDGYEKILTVAQEYAVSQHNNPNIDYLTTLESFFKTLEFPHECPHCSSRFNINHKTSDHQVNDMLDETFCSFSCSEAFMFTDKGLESLIAYQKEHGVNGDNLPDLKDIIQGLTDEINPEETSSQWVDGLAVKIYTAL